MPACVAWGCGAKASRGVLFKVFPRKDLKRRRIWIERVNLPGWSPTRYSALCEKHFDSEQWELPREDGKRKLKETAVPTIFCVEHPRSDDIVANEHSYCIVGYRQLYESSDTSNKLSNDYISFEHIKVEVDENRTFAPEEEQVEEAENIQCTPDIYEESENEEPDPIEMVQCEENETNPNMIETGIDPLAISQEDMKQAKSVVPHFQHSKKFLFVPKGTKLVSPSDGPPKVMGEPSVETQPPKLKVLSPEQLLQPHTASRIDSTMKKTVPTERKSLNLNEKRIPFFSGKNVRVILKKGSSDMDNTNNNTHLGHFCKRVPPLLSRNVNFGVCGSGSSIQVNDTRTLSSSPALIPSPPPLIPSPEFLKAAKVVSITPNLKNKLIKINGAKKDIEVSSKSQVLLLSKNSKRDIKINSKLKTAFFKEKRNLLRKKSSPISNSVEVCEKLEKVYLDHEYVGKPVWRPVSMDGMKMIKESSKSNSSVYRLIGNNDVKMWLTNNKICDKVNVSGHSKTSTKFKVMDPATQTGSNIQKVDSVCLSGSSVVLVDPSEKSRGSDGDPSIKLISPANRQKVNLFLCAICHCSFLTLATLKSHQSTHSVTDVRSVSSSSSTDTAEEIGDDAIMEPPFINKVDCKQSEGQTKTLIDPKQAIVNKNDDKQISNKINNDDMRNLIPPNVKLKKLVISLPKIDLMPTIKSEKQNIDMAKDPPNEKILRNKINNEKYSLRPKSKIIITKVRSKNNQNKQKSFNNKATIISSISGLKMKEKNKIVKEPLLNIKVNINKKYISKTNKILVDSTKSTDKLRSKVKKSTQQLKHTSCGVFVTKNKLNEGQQNSNSKLHCNICDKTFTKKFLLQRHIAEDHQFQEDKPYKCQWDMCSMMFTSKRQSENHSKICSKNSL